MPRPGLYHLIVPLLGLIPVASSTLHPANAEEAKANCEVLLQEEPFVDLLTHNVGMDAWQIASDHLGSSLVGSNCNSGTLKEYFSSAGWHFVGESFGYSVIGPQPDSYEQDSLYAFCMRRGFLARILMAKCRQTARVSMFEGRITHIKAGFNK